LLDAVPHPHTVALFLTLKCNYRCFFCTRGDNAGYGSVDFEKLLPLAPAIRDASMVDITGWGEPFLYPRMKEVIQFINQHNRKGCISVTTNGSLLKEEHAKLLSENLHHIVFSLNAASESTYERDMVNGHWSRVLENISRARRHLPGDKIIFSFVAHRENIHEFPQFVRMAHSFGVTRVSLTPVIVTKPENIQRSLWYDKELANDLIEAALVEGRRLGVEVGARRFSTGSARPPRDQACRSPYQEAFIGVDGKVGPCCYAGDHTMGNAFTEGGFDAVWNGAAYQALRKERHFPECRSCLAHASLDNLATHMGKNLFSDPKRYDFSPRFTAIIPIDGTESEQALAATIASLEWQTYPVWNSVLALNGAATTVPERLRAVLATLPEPPAEVRGVTLRQACAEALPVASGQYVAFLEPGTCWHPEKLERLLRAFRIEAGGPCDAVAHAVTDARPTFATRRPGLSVSLTAARTRPELAVAMLLGEPVPSSDEATFDCRVLNGRLDLRVPGVPPDNRDSYLAGVARRLNLAGEAAHEAGDQAAAYEAFLGAQAASPDYAEPYNNLAVAEWAAGRPGFAVELISKALAIAPDNTTFRENAQEIARAIQTAQERNQSAA
jgi:MoaA/NifB/PqqE/SkfB family radical SAM enzyme